MIDRPSGARPIQTMDDVIAMFLANPESNYEIHVPENAPPEIRRAAEKLHRMMRDVQEWVSADPDRARAFLAARKPSVQ